MSYGSVEMADNTALAIKTLDRGSNQSGMRAHNERLVLSLIRQFGQLAKSRITEMTGLSAQTVSVIMRALEADGLLEKGVPIRGKVGQPSVPMNLRRDGAFFLGLKVGRRSLDLVLTDFLGKPVNRIRESYAHPTPDRVVDIANDAIKRLLDELSEEQRSRVVGLGIALPFQLWGWADHQDADPEEMDSWRDRDISEDIGAKWPFPVYVCNDASAACGAELVFGTPDKPRNFLYFYVGFFIGGGLVLDNVLYTGQTGNAAAIGSTPVLSADGKRTQLVDVASLVQLEKALESKSSNSSMIWEDPESWCVPADVLNPWLEKTSDGIAQAVFSSACLIDFQCVLIDGWLPAAVREELVRRTRLRLAETHLAGIETPEVREGTVGSDARSLGAASLPLSERFLVDRTAFLKG
jgi:predicted NBD/HSP70 family sugar kinase